MDINRFPLVVFFRKKFSRAERSAEECIYTAIQEMMA